jgi:hypothetical protein
MQTVIDGSILGSGLCHNGSLTVPGTRLGQGSMGSLPLILLGRLLRPDLLLTRLALRGQGRELGPRFCIL